MERLVDIGSRDHTHIKSTDEMGPGGAYHDYEIECLHDLNGTCATIHFQKGGIVEAGINGCSIEDLIAICIDRLNCFQAGLFRCRENALAKTKLEESMMWLDARTRDRRKRGVEGNSIL